MRTILLLTLLLLLPTQSLALSLDQAKENPKLRQRYLNHLYKQVNPSYLKKIVYDEDGSLMRKEMELLVKDAGFTKEETKISIEKFSKEYDYLVPNELSLMGKEKKSILFIGSKGFNNDYTEDDYKSIIKHHNVYAQDIYHGLKIGNITIDYKNTNLINSGEVRAGVIYDLMYFRALYSQFMDVMNKKRKVSKALFRVVFKNVIENYTRLRDLIPVSEIEAYLIRNEIGKYKIVGDMELENLGK